MTVSTSRGTELTTDEIVVTAYQLAGLMNAQHGVDSPLWSSLKILGYRLLDTIVDEFQVENIQARAVAFYNLALTVDDYLYDLPAYVLDVLGDGMYLAASEADLTKATREIPVSQISREQWHELTTKSATGRPSMFFNNRNATPLEIRLWPIPNEAGTIRFQVHVKLTDAYEGNATLELRPYWAQTLIWELAHQLAVANSLPVEKCSYLKKEAKAKREKARIYSKERVPSFAYMDHDTPWTGR